MQKIVVRLSVLFLSLIAAVCIVPAIALAATFPVAVDATNFPDATWREYVNTNYAGGDYALTQAEADAVTSVNVSSIGIADLTGIGYFTNLTSLSCGNNSLTSLDLTGLGNLQYLDCANNSLTSLIVTGCGSLQQITGSYNSLLDIIGLSSSAEPNVASQTRTIRMVADPKGGLMSASAYPFDIGHSIGGLAPGVTFGSDNRFHMDELVASSSFITDLGTTMGFTMQGELTFEVATYTVTFVDWDGTVLGTETVIDEGTVTAPADPTRDGYRFIGWDTALDNITADTTVTALYEAEVAPTPTPSPTPIDTGGSVVKSDDDKLPQTGDAQFSLSSLAAFVLIGAFGVATALVAARKMVKF